MRLLWIRHGQMEVRASVANDVRTIDRLFNQEEQAGLSPRGRLEARQVSERLAHEAVDAVYSSPLVRARETAEVSARALGLEVRVTEAITEVRTGRLRHDSLSARWVRTMSSAKVRPDLKRSVLGATLIPLYFQAWRRGRTVGGESREALAARIRSLLADLERDHAPDACVALFAHGYLLVTLTYALGFRARWALLRRPYIPNGAISEMQLSRGRLRLRVHADTSHLRVLVAAR